MKIGGKNVKERAFAAAVGAEETKQLPFLDGKRNAF
jgi:hypothetical protein